MPKLPIRTQRFELDGDYAGFWIELVTNPPMGVYEILTEKITAQDLPRLFDALAWLTRSSNLVDRSEQPVDLSTPAGWREMPAEFLLLAADKLTEALKLPLAPKTSSSEPSSTEASPSPPSTP